MKNEKKSETDDSSTTCTFYTSIRFRLIQILQNSSQMSEFNQTFYGERAKKSFWDDGNFVYFI